jgi:putative hemolysin
VPSDSATGGVIEDMAELALLPAPSFSYASDEVGQISQRIIRGIEKITGQPRIRRLYEDYAKLGRPPELFWGDARAALRLDVDLASGSIGSLPPTGPQIVIANHPFGVVDGIILCWLVSQVRSDYKIMTHSILYQAPEVRRHIIPIDFSGSQQALAGNLHSRRAARNLLDDGGTLIVFPAGGVATSRTFHGPALDRPWGTFTAKLALQTDADILPVFFSGQNSRLYQMAAKLHQTLKLSLLFHEVSNKIGRRVHVAIGDIIPNQRLRSIGARHAITEYLKATTHRLKPRDAQSKIRSA